VAGRHFSERGERNRIDRPFAEIGQRPCKQVALVDGIEKLDRTRDLEPGDKVAPIRRCLGRGAQDDVPVTEPRPRELSVVSRRIARRRLVIRARLVPAPQRFRCAPLPIACARQRDRIAVALGQFGKMGKRGGGIVEEAQRDPASGELMLGSVVVLFWNCRVPRNAIGGLVLADVEQLARHEPALDPPLVGIERLSVIGR
jgi:hypothetical protein